MYISATVPKARRVCSGCRESNSNPKSFKFQVPIPSSKFKWESESESESESEFEWELIIFKGGRGGFVTCRRVASPPKGPPLDLNGPPWISMGPLGSKWSDLKGPLQGSPILNGPPWI